MAELQANGVALSDQDKADARAGLGLGSAALAATGDFATAAQGTDAREWSVATVLQAEAEAGTDTTRKAWTVQRVWQAAAAWWAGSAAKAKLDGIATGATANAADATLLARANHTGTQAASTISDFSAAADARIAAASLDALANVTAPSPTSGQVLQYNGTAWVPAPVSGAGVPSAFTSRALTDADDCDTLVCATAQTATVNTGLSSGFGCVFDGPVSFAGTATVTDVRTSGAADPCCALVQIGTDTYKARGSKV